MTGIGSLWASTPAKMRARFDDAGKPLVEDIRRQVFEMQVDVVLLLADAASFADLDRFGAADHIA